MRQIITQLPPSLEQWHEACLELRISAIDKYFSLTSTTHSEESLRKFYITLHNNLNSLTEDYSCEIKQLFKDCNVSVFVDLSEDLIGLLDGVEATYYRDVNLLIKILGLSDFLYQKIRDNYSSSEKI
jgi:uncharacterized protein (UPF0218 family)